MKRLAVLLGIVCVLVWVVDGDAQRRLNRAGRGTPSGSGDPLGGVGGQGVSGGGSSWTEATPSVAGVRLDDNAASVTVTAYVGQNWTTYSTNTSVVHTSDAYQGTGAFALTTGVPLAGPTTSLPSFSQFTDGTFTFQFALKATTAFNSSYYVRAFSIKDSTDDSEDIFMAIHGDTQLYFYLGGNEYTLTVNDLTTGAWQVLRVVFSTGTNKIAVYQGADEEHLSLTAYRTDTTTIGTVGSTTCYFVAAGDPGDSNKQFAANNCLIDDIKVWDTSVTP